MTRRLNFPVRNAYHWAEKVEACIADKPYREDIKIETFNSFSLDSLFIDSLRVWYVNSQRRLETMFAVLLEKRKVIFRSRCFFYDSSDVVYEHHPTKIYSFDLLYEVLGAIGVDLTLHVTKEGELNCWWIEEDRCFFKSATESTLSFYFPPKQPKFKRIVL